jgi:hypothetical protein
MKRLLTIIATACVLLPALALAQPKTADEWYKEGENQYNLGQFDAAVTAFKKGFELEPSDSKKAAYLYNIAQAYRELQNCKEAQFFYKRYLAFKDGDTKKPLDPQKRKEIEERIKDLDDCVKKQEEIRKKPPDATERPDGITGNPPNPGNNPDPKKPDDKKVGDVTPGGDGEEEDPGVTKSTTTQPKLISLRATGGGAKLTAGNVEIPVQATGALIGGYPLALNEKLTLDIGAAFTFTPVPFDTMTDESKSSQLIGLLANVGVTYEVIPKVGLRGDLGVGVLIFSGVNESPFTDFAETTGALTMLHLRLGVSADYAITPNVIATLTPIAFSLSPAAKGMAFMGEEISTVTAIDFMIGIGYRM